LTPQTETYPFPLSKRNRFSSETTADGKYDRTRARQFWHDPLALTLHSPNDPYPVHVVDGSGNYVVACTITALQASAANIDGIPAFPNAAVGPSGVILMTTGSPVIEPGDLIQLGDLTTLGAKITADTGVAPMWQEQAPLSGAGDWHLVRAQTLQTAGQLWGQQTLMGVGYPGKWSYSAHSGYSFQWADNAIFFPDPTVHFPLDPIPVPQDPLKDGEFLINSPNPMSSEKWVQHKDAQVSAGGGSSANDVLLKQIAADVAAIKKRIGA
jgi:hypothetical protein